MKQNYKTIDLSLLYEINEQFNHDETFLMRELIAKMHKHRPYVGMSIFYNAHMTKSSILQIEALFASGADVTLVCKKELRCDPLVVEILNKANIKLSKLNEIHNEMFDIAIDCSAGFLEINNTNTLKYGVAELTQTGVVKYQDNNANYPVISIDAAEIKNIETFFGTGDGFIRGMHKLTKSGLFNKKFVVFGFGKVGHGIIRGLSEFTNNIIVIEHNFNKSNNESKLKFPIYDIVNDRQKILEVLKDSYCIVTATGIKDLISSYFERDEIQAKYLVNMGSEDEWGEKFSKQEILNDKLAINFCLEYPTRLQLLDPVFYAQLIAIDVLLEKKLANGIQVLDVDIGQSIISKWILKHYSISFKGNYFEQVINNIPDFVYWKDLDSVYQGCNVNFANAAGCSSVQDIVGKTDYELAWKTTDAEIYKKSDQDVLNGNPLLNLEETQLQADGQNKIVLASKIPLFDDENNIIGIIGTYRDITDRKEKERLIIENELHKVTASEQDRFRKDVRQMIHDIATPLSSINNFVNNLGRDIPENTRVSLRHAAERIAGISQKLLSKYNGNSTSNVEQVFLMSLAVMEIVNERREDHRNTGVEIKLHIDRAATFVCIQHSIDLFKRMMTNLIKNAVESLKYTKNARVNIELRSNAKKVFILVKDNGPGMEEHIRDKVLQGIEITYGKGGEGHGLGLTQVIDTIRLGNGTYNIDIKDGTAWDIWFPKAAVPDWAASEIKLAHDDLIIILDDDESIHDSWNNIFKEALECNKKLRLEHFSDGAAAIEYIKSLGSEQKIFLLADQELLDQELSGIEIIEILKLERAMLVTSYSNNLKLQSEAIRLKVQILPKELVSYVKIHVGREIIKWSNHADMVWLEDKIWYANSLIQKYYNNLKVETYTNPFVFLEEVRQYPLTTKFILDTHFETPPPESKILHIDGFQIAEKLHEMGYNSIVVYIGEELEDDIPSYIKIVQKNDRDSMSKLYEI